MWVIEEYIFQLKSEVSLFGLKIAIAPFTAIFQANHNNDTAGCPDRVSGNKKVNAGTK